jgi:hypothetical protein
LASRGQSEADRERRKRTVKVNAMVAAVCMAASVCVEHLVSPSFQLSRRRSAEKVLEISNS